MPSNNPHNFSPIYCHDLGADYSTKQSPQCLHPIYSSHTATLTCPKAESTFPPPESGCACNYDQSGNGWLKVGHQTESTSAWLSWELLLPSLHVRGAKQTCGKAMCRCSGHKHQFIPADKPASAHRHAAFSWFPNHPLNFPRAITWSRNKLFSPISCPATLYAWFKLQIHEQRKSMIVLSDYVGVVCSVIGNRNRLKCPSFFLVSQILWLSKPSTDLTLLMILSSPQMISASLTWSLNSTQ